MLLFDTLGVSILDFVTKYYSITAQKYGKTDKLAYGIVKFVVHYSKTDKDDRVNKSVISQFYGA